MQAPLEERDLRGFPPTASELIESAAEHLNADSAYEVQANWDLWTCDLSTGSRKRHAQWLELICNGPEYDAGICAAVGHFAIELGMEHLFTGHIICSERAAARPRRRSIRPKRNS